MSRIISLLLVITIFSTSNSQNTLATSNSDVLISDLDFLTGKWKAIAKDSSFSSVLEYQYSPNGKFLIATNHLYNKDDELSAIYEGAYLCEGGSFLYFVSGPNGETHKGSVFIKGEGITHLAQLFPGKGIKSYRSELLLKDDKLCYYANYSKEKDFPKEVDYSNPLIYQKTDVLDR